MRCSVFIADVCVLFVHQSQMHESISDNIKSQKLVQIWVINSKVKIISYVLMLIMF